MIIDLILDRKDGVPYNPREFYHDCMWYENHFKFPFSISKIMDEGTEQEVKHTICEYVISQGYNPAICDYVNSVNWLTND